jgi:hypothetical protein
MSLEEFVPLENDSDDEETMQAAALHPAGAVPFGGHGGGFNGTSSPGLGIHGYGPAAKRKANALFEDSMMDVEEHDAGDLGEESAPDSTPPSRHTASPSLGLWGSAMPSRAPKSQRLEHLSRRVGSPDGSQSSFSDHGGFETNETLHLRARVAELERLVATQQTDNAENAASAAQQYTHMETQRLLELQRWQNRAGELEERLERAGDTVAALRKENEQLRSTIHSQGLERLERAGDTVAALREENEQLRSTIHRQELEFAQKAEHFRAELGSVLAKTKEPFETLMSQYRKLATLTEIVASDTSPQGTLEEL